MQTKMSPTLTSNSVIWAIFSLCCIMLHPSRSLCDSTSAEPDGGPLFLTPLIEAGRYEEAKNLSRVGHLNGTNISSFSGYLTVNPLYNSNMFFWFIPALNNCETAPVVLWLQGGPGATSLYSLFLETGPWRITPEIEISEANYTWSSVFSMLYIDNPVGTGLSFTHSDLGFANNQDDVARNLYNALQQFFTFFSEYQHQEFYVAGESYAGKYVPAIAHKIQVENPSATININLKGISIGNGLVDPTTQVQYADFLFNIGLIDKDQRHLFQEQENLALQNIQAGNFLEALRNFDTMMFGHFLVNNSYFHNFTGFSSSYNIIRSRSAIDYLSYSRFLEKSAVRKSIHVEGNPPDYDTAPVTKHLLLDIMNTTKPWVESLLNAGSKVLIYSGMVDACVPYVGTQNMIASLNWSRSEEYKVAKRIIWRVDPDDSEVAGYVKQVHNLLEVGVRNAGHVVPIDQPRSALDMITRFVFNKPF